MDEWYAELKDITFPTQFVSLSMRAIDAILHKHEKKESEEEKVLLGEVFRLRFPSHYISYLSAGNFQNNPDS